DPARLAPFRDAGIEPETVARRLLHAWRWGLFENLFYFTSPHPANVVVRPGGRIALLDFAEIGWTSPRLRRLQLEFERNLRRGDIGAAADFMIQSILPLAHIDVHELTKKTEQRLWQCYYALRVKSSRPIERTMAGAWLSFLEVAASYGVTVPLATVKMIHSTLLYEELAARLWPEIDGKPFRSYLNKARRRREEERERAQGRTRPASREARLVVAARAAEHWTYWLGSIGGHASLEFMSMASKEAYVVGMALRVIAAVGYILFFGYLLQLVMGADAGLVRRILLHPVTLVAFAASLIPATRLVFFRLSDHDPDE
ncbi:MAG TPA: AarF/UbiB family protein, partial [Vicinamibacteria bacterium]|nr:AarF/UbiB family protein [Vicinamibacteria bacterium]